MPYVTSFERWGHRRGLQEGRQEGLQEGRLASLRESTLHLYQERWGAADPALREKLAGIDDEPQLQSLLVATVRAGSAREFLDSLGSL